MRAIAVPLAAFLLTGLACGEPARPPRSATPRWNVLLITLDTLRADRLGCHGYSQATSPVLDELASGAVLFEHAVAQSAVTPVSHASILTGLNPYRHGLRSLHGGKGYALPEDVLTLAELLRDHGWWGHSILFQEQVRVPLIISLPDGRWKLIARFQGSSPKPSHLFDLRTDRGETMNLIEARPDVHERLRAHLMGLNALAAERLVESLDEETRLRLEALGYVD